MKVLVTGGSGFIGRTLCKELVARGDDVVVVSRSKHEDLANVKFIEGDVTNSKCFEGIDVGVIYHLAANPSVWFSKKKPLEDFRINALGTMHVLELARKCNARIVYSSSIALYDGALEKDAFAEEDIQPSSFYALSKWTGEKYCKQYLDTFGVKSVVLRFGFVYGPGVSRGPVYDIRSGKVYFHPDSAFDFVHVKDVVRALLLAGDSDIKFDVFNIGSGRGVSIKELISLIKLDLKGKKGVAKKLVLDVSKAKKLGWEPEISLEEGL